MKIAIFKAWHFVGIWHVKYHPTNLEQDECCYMLLFHYHVNHVASTKICIEPTQRERERELYNEWSNVLGSKELGTNVLELHFVMLANHDQNVLVLF